MNDKRHLAAVGEAPVPHEISKLDALNTVEEVAAFAKVSPRTVMRAIAAGKLEALRAGAQLRITDRAVWAWLESGQRE
ncbi:MAG: helix-turn-helix domain-containing protein [Gaiellaceae bacterium]